MHERTRRQICQLLFVTLVVLPVMVTVSWAGYRVSPLHARYERKEWERKLFELTGLIASVETIQHPAGSTLLGNIELLDPDGNDRVARLRQIEIATTSQGLVVLLSQPELADGKFLRVWDTLHDRVLRGPMPAKSVQISAGEVTLEVGEKAQTFTRVCCTIEPRNEGVRALIDFQLAGYEMPSPAQLTIERNRQILPPETRWMLHTETPIPCDLFKDYAPSLAQLGPHATFYGTVGMSIGRGTWSGDLRGRFDRVDLDVLSEPLRHPIRGLSTITVQRAVVHQGKLVETVGSMSSGAGSVSPLLLKSLAEHVRATVPLRIAEWPQPYVSFDAMNFDFRVSAGQISLAGRCAGAAEGTVMAAQSDSLLVMSNSSPHYPLAAILRGLSPDSQWLVPATDGTQTLISMLPLGPDRQRTDTIAQPPRARVKLRN